MLWKIQRWLLFRLPPEASHRVVIWGLMFNGWLRDLVDRWERRLDKGKK